MEMNTWHTGGSNQSRGFRPWATGVGAPFSQHKFGRASDLEPQETTAEEIRQDILSHPDLDEFKFIRCVEKGVASAINQFVETDDEKRAAELLVMKMQQQPDRWQTLINMVEAKHRSIFVAGWRPAAGWV
jgi:hypothetical protein